MIKWLRKIVVTLFAISFVPLALVTFLFTFASILVNAGVWGIFGFFMDLIERLVEPEHLEDIRERRKEFQENFERFSKNS